MSPADENPSADKEQRKSADIRRLSKLLIVCAAAIVIGIGLTSQFGYGLRPASPADIDGVGHIETIRLPTDARSLAEVTSLVITMPKADDFGKVYLNNFIVVSNEDPERLYYLSRDENEAKRVSNRFGVLRNLTSKSRDPNFVNLVVAGWNFIVMEVENSFYGECSSSIDIVVNGKRLEKFPRTLPKNEYAEISAVNPNLLHKFSKAEAGELINALCARRIFAFYVRG
jgi:hypothetical protein